MRLFWSGVPERMIRIWAPIPLRACATLDSWFLILCLSQGCQMSVLACVGTQDKPLIENADSPTTVLEPSGLGGVRLVRGDDEIGLLRDDLALETLSLSHRTVESDRFL
jgi:hypothetical protein